MKQYIEIKRMQQLAGIVTESEYQESQLASEDKDFFKQKSYTVDKGAGSGSQSFVTTNNGKEIKLNKVKPGMPVRVKVYYNMGSGSGSQGWYDVEGFVKSLDGDKLRTIRKGETSKKSVGIDIRNITKIYDLS